MAGALDGITNVELAGKGAAVRDARLCA